MDVYVNESAAGVKREVERAGAEAATRRAALLFRLGPGLALLLAVGLRFYRLAGQSFWSDEGNSVALARAGLGEIAARTALDIHPPLYYWLLHAWMRVVGDSEVAVRCLSAAAGVLLVAVVYRLGKRLLDPWAGLLAAVIAAVSPFQVYYAQEARMYALLALLGAVTVWATVELMGQERAAPAAAGHSLGSLPSLHSLRSRRTVAYGLLYMLAATLGLYTHYAFPVVPLAANAAVFTLLLTKRKEMRVGRPAAGWLLLQIIPLALYAPWLPIAWRQLTTWPAPLLGAARDAFLSVWRVLILGPTASADTNWWLLGLALLGLLGALYLVRERALPATLLLLLYLGLPIALTLVLFKPAYLKFLLVASPALCLLLAAGLAGDPAEEGISWGGWLGAGLIAAAAWGPLNGYYHDPAVARDDYRGMARYLEAVAGPRDAILLNAPGQQEVFGYYYRGRAPVYPLPRQRPLDREATVRELETMLAGSQRIFALYWAADESDPKGVIESWLKQRTFKARDVWMGNVRLASYAAPLPAADLPPADLRLGEHVRLTGYRLLCSSTAGNATTAGQPGEGESPACSPARPAAPGEIVQVQLRWQTDAALGAQYRVFVQALDSANHLVAQRDAAPVVGTPDWRPGQPVLDRHGLLVEPGTPPGDYRVIAGLYDVGTGQRLPAGQGDFLELGVIRVERPATPPPLAALHFRYPAGEDVGALRLLGYERYRLGHSYAFDAPLNPGDPLHVVLYWQAGAATSADWQVSLRVVPMGGAGPPIAEGTFPAAGVDYPTSRWAPGEVVRAQFDLFLPADAAAGVYPVAVALTDGTGSPETKAFSLAPISIR
jgi:4-amino-4-deoxy-L-arabinose transferase-like glycosyltransferase